MVQVCKNGHLWPIRNPSKDLSRHAHHMCRRVDRSLSAVTDLQIEAERRTTGYSYCTTFGPVYHQCHWTRTQTARLQGSANDRSRHRHRGGEHPAWSQGGSGSSYVSSAVLDWSRASLQKLEQSRLSQLQCTFMHSSLSMHAVHSFAEVSPIAMPQFDRQSLNADMKE